MAEGIIRTWSANDKNTLRSLVEAYNILSMLMAGDEVKVRQLCNSCSNLVIERTLGPLSPMKVNKRNLQRRCCNSSL